MNGAALAAPFTVAAVPDAGLEGTCRTGGNVCRTAAQPLPRPCGRRGGTASGPGDCTAASLQAGECPKRGAGQRMSRKMTGNVLQNAREWCKIACGPGEMAELV